MYDSFSPALSTFNFLKGVLHSMFAKNYFPVFVVSHLSFQCRHDFVHGQFKENLQKMPDEPKKQEMLLRMLILEMLLIAKDEHMQQRDRASQLQQIFKRRYEFWK